VLHEAADAVRAGAPVVERIVHGCDIHDGHAQSLRRARVDERLERLAKLRYCDNHQVCAAGEVGQARGRNWEDGRGLGQAALGDCDEAAAGAARHRQLAVLRVRHGQGDGLRRSGDIPEQDGLLRQLDGIGDGVTGKGQYFVIQDQPAHVGQLRAVQDDHIRGCARIARRGQPNRVIPVQQHARRNGRGDDLRPQAIPRRIGHRHPIHRNGQVMIRIDFGLRVGDDVKAEHAGTIRRRGRVDLELEVRRREEGLPGPAVAGLCSIAAVLALLFDVDRGRHDLRGCDAGGERLPVLHDAAGRIAGGGRVLCQPIDVGGGVRLRAECLAIEAERLVTASAGQLEGHGLAPCRQREVAGPVPQFEADRGQLARRDLVHAIRIHQELDARHGCLGRAAAAGQRDQGEKHNEPRGEPPEHDVKNGCHAC